MELKTKHMYDIRMFNIYQLKTMGKGPLTMGKGPLTMGKDPLTSVKE